MITVTGFLRPEHLAAGLRLVADPVRLYLRARDGRVVATWHDRQTTVAEVLHAADQEMNWSRSGVTFQSPETAFRRSGMLCHNRPGLTCQEKYCNLCEISRLAHEGHTP